MFPGVTVQQAEAGKAAAAAEVSNTAAAGGLFSAASGLLGPVGAGLGIAGQLGMFNGGNSGTDMSKAVSGGTFYTGPMSYGGELSNTNTLIIVAVVVLGLLLIFKGKKGK